MYIILASCSLLCVQNLCYVASYILLCLLLQLILLMLGLKDATSNHACAWCTVHKNQRFVKCITYLNITMPSLHRWDMKVQDTVYLKDKQRTLKMLKEKKLKDSLHKPILNIELDYVIPDELHLLLRITDVLINNFITSAVSYDISNSTGKPKPLEGPMTLSLITEIRKHIGVQFNIYEKEKVGWKFSSLSGE